MSIDVPQLFRFGVTGFVVAVVYIGLYTALYHAGVAPFTANLVAFLTAVLFQYVGQTCWTFRRKLWDSKQSMRFAVTTVLGVVYSSLIASGIAPAAAWQPWMAAGFVAVTLPILNYIAFRLWVFRADPVQESNP